MDVPVGQIVFSSEALGTGGQGVVTKGIWLNATYAIKSIRATGMEESAVREIKILGRVHHANIISIFGVCQQPPVIHIIMEYFHCVCLKDALFVPNMKIIFTMEEKHAIAYQCSNAICYLHQENTRKPVMVHTDIKPSNILVSLDFTNGERITKICDFGLAKFKGANTTFASTSGSIGGTTGYIAPEDMTQKMQATTKSDI